MAEELVRQPDDGGQEGELVRAGFLAAPMDVH